VAPIAGRNLLAVELATSLAPALPSILSGLRNLFDLDARPDVIAGHLRGEAKLAQIVARTGGLRVPGALDGFELAVRAILGQQVSVKAASTLAGRLAARFGESIETPLACLNRLAPTAERLAHAPTAQLTELGITHRRAETIRALARAEVRRAIDLSPGPQPENVAAALVDLPGIGPWTAEYVAMRALRWPDAFPSGDLGLVRASGLKNARALHRAAETWRPWRAYAAMYLWESL
jgi:AraC family transcriptional regulator of adaptative response / DNA-3-methyladenine glycosylase II